MENKWIFQFSSVPRRGTGLEMESTAMCGKKKSHGFSENFSEKIFEKTDPKCRAAIWDDLHTT